MFPDLSIVTDLIPSAAVNADGYERAPAGEAEALRIIVGDIERRVRAAAQAGAARRDAHVKAHGCVRAEFTVLSGLPAALRAGLFAEPRTYQAWIRFSNGAGTAKNDRIGDGRGMAIKVMGVEQSRSTTQDFVMINNPTFFVRDAVDYVDFQTASPQWRFFLPGWNPFALRWRELLVAYAITSRATTNPLNSRYWSMTPYLWGEAACKYSARPVDPPSGFDDTASPDFLHDNLARQLAGAGAQFDFMAQHRTQPDAMPIEDPRIEWSESAAPFTPVARITIPPQSFDEPADHALCENLSFTPWHGIAAHRPLGGINRVRRTVYETVSRLRHELNGVPRYEPTGF